MPAQLIDGLHVETSGDGAAVLFVSGLGYSGWCWRQAAEFASRERLAIVPDARGTGRSASIEGESTVKAMATDVARVIETLGASPAHVVAHSMGGYIALTLASGHPELVRSLTLIGTSAGGSSSAPVPAATLAAWQAAAGHGSHEFARRTMPLSFAPGWADDHPPEFESLLAERLAHPTAPENWQRQYSACERWLRDGIDAARVAVPALVIHGTEDRVVPCQNGQSLARRLPLATFLAIRGGGHLCFLERAEEFSSALRLHMERTEAVLLEARR